MNMKTTKFLAVLAVLAMAFAAFAVAIPETDATGETDFVDTEQSFKIKTGASTTQTVKLYALSTATVKKTPTGAAFSGYMVNSSPNFGVGDNYWYMGYAEVGLFFGNMSAITTGSISIKQETSFVSLFGATNASTPTGTNLNPRQSVDADKTYMTSIFDLSELSSATYTSEAASAFGILVPQDGSQVKLTLSTYSGAVNKTEGNHKWKCTGDPLDEVTYILDFSETTTKIVLDNTNISGTYLWSEQKWSYNYSSNKGTLTLNGVDAQASFYGGSNLTSGLEVIIKDGTENSLEAYTQDSIGIINNAKALTVKDSAESTRTAGSLSLEQSNPKGFGLRGSTVTIGDISATSATTLYTVLASEGGAQAIYSETTVAICNADIDVSAGERGIRATTTLTTTGYNDIVAEIDGTYNTNGQGTDDIWGIKTGGAVSIGANTTIYTDGFRAENASLTMNGILYIDGDYGQNINAISKTGLATYIAGLYLDAYASNLTITKVALPIGGEAGKIYFIGDTDFYVPSATVTIDDKINDKKEYQATADTSDKIGNAITAAETAGAKDVVVNVTAAIDGLSVTTKVGQTLELRTTTAAAKLTGTVTLTGATAAQTNSVELSGVQGAIVFGYGSIVADVIIWTDGDIVLKNNDVLKISGSEFGIMGDVSVKGPIADGESAKIIVEDGQTLIINEDCTLTIEGNVSMNNDGAIVGEGTIYVDEDATFYTAKPVLVYFEGNGKIITEDAMETLKISDKLASSMWAHPTQKVLVTGNLSIKAGQYLVITGELEIPTGVTVTIEEGGLLMLEGPTASAVIDGTVKAIGRSTSTEFGPLYAAFTVYSTVTGDIEINGEVIAAKSTATDDLESVDIDGNANINGKVTINPKAAASFGEAIVSEGGQLVNNGTMSGTVYNAGTVIINGKVSGSSIEEPTIYMAAADAVVDVQALKSGDDYDYLVIDDDGMYMMTKVIDGKAVPIEVTDNNKIVLENVGGLKVTEGIKYYYIGGERFADNITYIEGALGFGDSKENVEPTVTVSEGTATVATTLDIVKAQLVVYADLSVLGSITVDNSETYKLYDGVTVCTPNIIVNGGDTTAYGLIQVTGNALVDETYINAVLYEKRVESKTVYYYTNLTDAIASGATEFEVLGELYVIEDTTIPAGVNVDAAGHDVYIGTEILYPDVTLTVANGGSLSAGSIEVVGTLYIANTDSGISCSNIISDTSNIGESDALYTNIYKALSTAESGDVVKITKKNDGTVSIEKDATVASGVTLIVPASKTLQIYEGTTLTINGFLQNKGTITAVKYDDDGYTVPGKFAEKVDNGKYAVIKVNGMIESMSAMPYKTATGGYFIAGAYYAAKTLYYISTVEAAALLIQSVDSQTIDINGTVAVDEVAFIGSDSKPVIVNINGNTVGGGSFTADTITYNDATINFTIAGLKVNGTFTNVTGSVAFANVQTTKVSSIGAYTVSDGDEVMDVLYVAGGFKHSTSIDDMKNAPKMTFDGAVLIKDELVFDGSYKGTGKTTTAGTFSAGSITIDSDAVVSIADVSTFTGKLYAYNATVTINGTLTIYDGGDFKTDSYEGYASEYGNPVNGYGGTGSTAKKNSSVNVYGLFSALDVATEDAAVAGTVEILGTLSVGSNDISDAASVYGKVKPDVLVIYPGSIILGELLEDISKPSAVYTEFYIEGDLWKTIYNLNNSALNSLIFKNISTKLTDRMFDKTNHWMSATGSVYEDTKVVGDYQKAYANILYNIYKVTIYTDAGVKSVSIDGIEMWNQGTNMFVTPTGYELIAGTHTVSYTMKDGYSGTPTLKTSDGILLKDYKFLTTGTDDDDRAVFLQLNGTDPTPEPEPEPTPTPEEKSEWTVTTILLCVLVVLIAIMAVIVALRLNRN